jgi:hypothetical protein
VAGVSGGALDPERELSEVSAEIERLEGELRPLRARYDRLRSILAGPRVEPVLTIWEHGERREESGYDSLGRASLVAEYQAENGDCWIEGVSVGGAVLSESERAWRAEEERLRGR